ncbi:MAG TPA: tRNA epoxyqueuosine(34) reductase QueG [Pirellulaceae bacterium]|nr:tRNA epoxyqueuosine(34) reductase QueG [Pirellulaceae bacterium]
MNEAPTKTRLAEHVKAQAARLGFALCGIAPAITPLGVSRFHDWLSAGYAGEMRFLTDRATAYEHPRHVLENVRSVVMLALPYRTVAPQPIAAGQGRVSRYAWGEADYHDVIHDRLHTLADDLRAQSPGASVRGVVDTAPLLEREFAQLAGLGWIGKNTLLLNKQRGSWFFLAALLTDIELDHDAPMATDHCGTCTACLDACPTHAFPAPYVLDASRCVSYLNIELRGPAPPELRSGIGDWLLGCDICQDVCPWNHKPPTTSEPAFQPRDDANPLELLPLFELTDAAFRQRFRHTPLWRPKRRGILRNAAIILGNQRATLAVPALVRGLNDDEPLIRGACAWALGQIATAAAITALQARMPLEDDAIVQQELARALKADSP